MRQAWMARQLAVLCATRGRREVPASCDGALEPQQGRIAKRTRAAVHEWPIINSEL
jgi:hypothetical protein